MSILPRFTDAGKALQLRALAGDEIKFTKIQIGSGTLGETSYKTFNALLDPKVTIPIADISVSDGYAAVRGYFSNEKIAEGFYYRELGLFAEDPDDKNKEILYCYGNSGDHASYIADPGSVLIERAIKIIAVVDDAEKVSAVINGSAVYVDFTDMKKAIAEHNADAEAHASLRNLSVVCYVDCNSTEDDSMCDGSYDHPLKSLIDVQGCFGFARSLTIILKSAGEYHFDGELYLDATYFPNLEQVYLCYHGSSQNQAEICGSILFAELTRVFISNVKWSNDADWSVQSSLIDITSCSNCYITGVSAYITDGSPYIFCESYDSTVYFDRLKATDFDSAINAFDSTYHLTNCSFDTGSEAVNCSGSVIYNYDNEDMTIWYDGGIVFDPKTMQKISNGELLKHLESDKNPHRVSLEQAQKVGGLIDVAHGGTGQSKLVEGALLKGNGSGAVGMLKGTGAVYAAEAGTPKFGTLPISMGGTGNTTFKQGSVIIGNDVALVGKRGVGAFFATTEGAPIFATLPVNLGGTGMTSFPTKNSIIIGGGLNMPLKSIDVLPPGAGGTGQRYISYGYFDDAATTYKGRHVQFVVPGTDVLVWAGRIIIKAGNEFDCHLSWSGNKVFADNRYALILSEADVEEAKVTRFADHFHVDSQAVGDRVTDFVAIGRVATST